MSPQEQSNLPATLPEEHVRRALLEAVIYVAEQPLTPAQISESLSFPLSTVTGDLDKLIKDYKDASRGIEVRVVAGGYKMFTKAEYHEAVRSFVKTLRPKFKLSRPALETLSVIAYKQPVTIPEMQAVRGVNVTGVVHTLLSRKLISTAGRKKIMGRPMMYKTTKEFLVQFGLSDLSELPNLKELEELSRNALSEDSTENAKSSVPEVTTSATKTNN
jgi:segregation and condensation protein B